MSYPIIDFHVHPFRKSEFCLNFYPEMEPLDAAGMRQQIEQAGIAHICGSVLRGYEKIQDFEQLRSLNREALELQEQLNGFYTPGFHIHPAFVRESCEEIEQMHRRGIRLIGELVPYMHHWGDFSERNWAEILELAAQYRMICCYHTPFDYDMSRMISAFPDVTFVAAHPGDSSRVPEHIELMQKYDNVLLDLSGTGLFRFGVVKHLVRAVGAERILFGSDYPICNMRMYAQAVYGEDLSDADRELIFYKNAQRVLGLAE